jgi:hypothetical protein
MHFLITGDSWSQGEWDGYPYDYKITHQGIHQYLLNDQHQVTNVGQGGYNNIESFHAIPNIAFDHLIFFYTDPLRQALESEIKNHLPFDIISKHNNHLHQLLLELKLQKQCKITLIGGCAKYLGNKHNIDYVISSVSELLTPNFVDSEFMTSQEWEHYFHIHEKNYTSEQKKQWLIVMTEAGKKYSMWKKNKDMFWPDGLHANRYGTFAVYQVLKSLWTNV